MTVDQESETLQFQLSKDPVPGAKPSRSQKASAKRGRPTNASKENASRTEVKKQVEALLYLVGVPLSMRDEHCAGALVQQTPEIADALADIAMDNDRLMAILMSGGDVMKYMKLVTALMPVGMMVYQHHFVRLEGGDEVDGDIGDRPME